MKAGDLITIDSTSKKYPFFIEKNNEGNKAWITCEVKINETEIWEGEVTNISSSGKYIVRLTKKVE